MSGNLTGKLEIDAMVEYHPTIEGICNGCERNNTADCEGSICRQFINPAGK